MKKPPKLIKGLNAFAMGGPYYLGSSKFPGLTRASNPHLCYHLLFKACKVTWMLWVKTGRLFQERNSGPQ